jgi:predicted RNA-binding Zn ribbon-like protein
MASGFRLADPREYRRGVILGLTLAEILILLVFLLLLSAGALLARRNHELGSLEAKLASFKIQMGPVLDRLRERGIEVRDTDELVARLERAANEEKARQQLADAMSALAEVRVEAARAAREAADLRARLNRVPANAKEMANKVAEANAMAGMLGQAGASGGTPPEKLKHVLEQASRQAQANRNLTGQNAQMRNELARMKGNGGSGLPYCWTTPEGRPIYMLHIELHDDAVVVSDVAPRPRPDDPAWPLLDSLPRGEPISIETMISSVAPLQKDAAAAKCRYGIEAFDGTGKTNKPGYKYLMGRLWSVFMVREVR